MVTEAFGVKLGDRVKLLKMNDPYDPVPPGSTGTVYSICSVPGIEQICVDWDNGRTLNLIPNVDSFTVI